MKRRRLGVGVLGVGRLGQVYARHVSGCIAGTRLAAVADLDEQAARQVADELGAAACYDDPMALIEDPNVEAIVIVTPTSTHRDMVMAAIQAKKPTFCEKPLSVSLNEALEIQNAVESGNTYFQMGFMRRFDPGYSAAKRSIDAGNIGSPAIFKSTSRDPYRPPLEYANPKLSGGMIVDMGIHDFDLALWLMGPIRSVSAVGGVLVYPELGEIGDLDNAIVTLTFESGAFGVVDLSRKGVYGYDISTEILGSAGAVRVGYLRETPVLTLTASGVSYDTVPYFPERFAKAYVQQLSDFAQGVIEERAPAVQVAAGVEALRVAIAATKAQKSGKEVRIDSIQGD